MPNYERREINPGSTEAFAKLAQPRQDEVYAAFHDSLKPLHDQKRPSLGIAATAEVVQSAASQPPTPEA